MQIAITALDDPRFERNSSHFAPLQPVRLAVSGARRTGSVGISVADGRGTVYAAKKVAPEDGQATLELRVRGALGRHTVKVMPEGPNSPMIMGHFQVTAETRVVTGDEVFDDFVERVKALMLNNIGALFVRGDVVKGYQSPDTRQICLRHHTHQMRGFKYWEPDMRSVVDHFCEAQLPDGSFYDGMATGASGPDHDPTYHWRSRYDEQRDVRYSRSTVLADVEYLAVEAVYTAWQATGDDEWMRTKLPALEKALIYSMTDPQRWSPQYELVKRGFTIDTWDFECGEPVRLPDGRRTHRREIDQHTRFGIMHGDNTGMCKACRLLAVMFEHCALPKKAHEWQRKAEHFQRRVNDVCWNGTFYRHHVHIDAVDAEGVDEHEQLSLSNACSLNRGTMTPEMAASVIGEYQRRRDLRQETHFAEWFSIDPPFPSEAFGLEDLRPGSYVNGGIMPLVGGELARGALEHGFEAYGVDILRRYYQMIAVANTTYLWYHPDGTPSEQEPALPADGLGAAAMLYAFVEGLCGVEDEGKLFERVHLSPRWPAADVPRALVCVKYGASDGYFCYEYTYDKTERRIRLELTGSGAGLKGHVLLPAGLTGSSVEADGAPASSRECAVNGAPYVEFEFDAIPRRIVVSG